MRLRMLNDAVLVEPIDAEGFTERGGGLIVAKRNWEPRLARVIAVGSGHWRKGADGLVPLWVNVGDVIVYGNMAGQEFTDDDGIKCRILREADIFSIWEGPIPNVVLNPRAKCASA